VPIEGAEDILAELQELGLDLVAVSASRWTPDTLLFVIAHQQHGARVSELLAQLTERCAGTELKGHAKGGATHERAVVPAAFARHHATAA
jgi:hypothetical protein